MRKKPQKTEPYKLKSHIAELLAEHLTDIPIKRVHESIDALLSYVRGALADGTPVAIRGFGRFTVYAKSACRAHNPLTSEISKNPPRKLPRFKPACSLMAKLKVLHERG